MNNLARPKVREQFDPDALAIIDAIAPVLEGYDDDGNPNWSGLDEKFWAELLKRPKEFTQLISICQRDFPTFCGAMLKIVSKETVVMRPFIFNCAQNYMWNRHIVSMIVNGLAIWVAVLKSRQVGISTFVCAWQFWQIWRQRDVEVLMVGNTKVVVESLMDNFRMFHDELPNIDTVRPRLRADKAGRSTIPKHEAYFADRRCKAVIMVDKNFSTRGLHGISFQLSEAAHYDDLETVLLTLKPLLPPLGTAAHKRSSIWVETTPRGQNYFFQLYNLAKEKNSSYHAVFIPWMVSEDIYSLDPPRGFRMTKEMMELQQRLSVERRKHDGKDVTRAQMYWRHREMIDQNQNDEWFEQEYPSNDSDCFLLQTSSVFKESLRWLQQSCALSESMTVHEWAKRNVTVDAKSNYVQGEIEYPDPPGPFADKSAIPKFMPKFKIRPGGPLTVWSPPQRGHVYVGGVDPSGGTGGDNAIVQIVDVTEGAQVAEFADDHVGPEELADIAVAIGYWYNTALILPEVNVYSATMKRMKQVWFYPKVGREEKWDEPALKKTKFGYYLNESTKRALVMEMRFIIANRHLRIGSRQLLAELSTFEEDRSDGGIPSYNGAKGSHDDRVIGLGLALMAVKQSPKLSSLLLSRNHDKVPTAADLGLTTAPAADMKPNAHLDDDLSENPWSEMDPQLVRALDAFGKPAKRESGFPVNPISGH